MTPVVAVDVAERGHSLHLPFIGGEAPFPLPDGTGSLGIAPCREYHGNTRVQNSICPSQLVVLSAPLVFYSGGRVVELQRARDRHFNEPYYGGLSDLGVFFWNVSHQIMAGLRASSHNPLARTVAGIDDSRTFC
jgi:hypothetical protein